MRVPARIHWLSWSVLVAICAGPWLVARTTPPIEYVDRWPSGQDKLRAVSVRTADGVFVFDGEYRAFHENGQLQISGRYERGAEQGPWQWFDADGRPVARCEYRDGEGAYVASHPSGAPWWRGTMRGGKRVGEWEELDDAGRVLKRGSYVDGEPDGLWSYFGYDDSSGVADAYEGRWDRGDLLESDGGYIRSPALRLGWAEHLLGAALSLLLFVAPWLLAFSLSRGATLAERWLAAAVLATAIWIAGALLLGVVGLLHRPGLVAVCASMLVLGWRRGGWAPCRDAIGGLLRVELSAPERALACVLFVLIASCAATQLLEPTVNFDSLAYHLPVLTDWLQGHSLRAQPELGQVAWYAFSFELCSLLGMIALGGDATSSWPNLFALAICALSVFVVGRRAGLSRLASASCAGLLLLVPEFARRAGAVQPDIAVAAFFAAALVLAHGTGTRAAFWCALALLASSKMSGLGYALLVLLLCAPRLAALWSWRAVAAALPLAVFWLARNLWLAGNPFGVLAFGPWQGELRVEELRAGSLARLWSPFELRHWRIVASALWSVMAWPAASVLVIATLARGRRAASWWAAFAGALLLYAVAPYSGDNGQNGFVLTPWMANNLRFAFPALVMLAMLSAQGLARFAWPQRVLWLVVAAGAVWLLAEVVAPRAMVLIAFCAIAALWGFPSARRSRVAFALLLLLFAIGVAREGRRIRHAARLELYGIAYEWCQRRVAPDETVGILLTERRYPWVGPRLSRPVVDATPAAAEGYADWIARLDEKGIEALVIGGPNSAGTQDWLLDRVAAWTAREDFPFARIGSFDSQKRDEALYLRER